jgi:hypothetical protein
MPPRSSGLLANSSAGFPNPLLNAAAFWCNSFAISLKIDSPDYPKHDVIERPGEMCAGLSGHSGAT